MFRIFPGFSVKYLSLLSVSILLTFGAVPAKAALVSVDDPVFGTDSVTFDTNTNLEWLDVTVSLGQGIDVVSSGFGAGGTYEGWRYATGGEVLSMLQINGMRGDPGFFGTGYGTVFLFFQDDFSAEVSTFISLFGDTYGGGTSGQFYDAATGLGGLAEIDSSQITEVYTPYTIGTSQSYYDSNYGNSPAGVGSWLVRDAFTPGGDPTNPLLPNDPLASTFVFDATAIAGGLGTTNPLFIDPEVAIGYDYTVENGGPNFASVLIPDLLADDEFLVSFFDELGNEITQSLFAGIAFDFLSFVTGGVDAFSITDIDPSLMLDPGDPQAFVTGVTFVEAAENITVTMTPRTSVPEALSLAMFGLGIGALAGIGCIRRKRTAPHSLRSNGVA